jgi:hypothetical protein
MSVFDAQPQNCLRICQDGDHSAANRQAQKEDHRVVLQDIPARCDVFGSTIFMG